MTRRSILNLTSTKKRDTMLQTTNMVLSRSNPTTYSSDDAIMKGGDAASYIVPWVCTARLPATDTNGNPDPEDTPARGRTTVFMRGLKERLTLTTNNGLPWQWRRIVFATKGFAAPFPFGGNFYLYNNSNYGYRRTWNETPTPSIRLNLTAPMFKGVEGVDWKDEIVAPIDTSRITLLYDKVRMITSGNDRGAMKSYSMWHGINKNFIYDDDEDAGKVVASPWHTLAKQGVGDVMIVDIFRPRGGSSATDTLSVGSSTTLYWHEK